MIENRDRIVTKEELNEKIWNGRVVSEAALSTRIRAIRRALGDDGAQQKFLRTYPKRGFQFVARIEPTENMMHKSSDRRSRGPSRPSWVFGVAALLVLVLIGTAAGWWWQENGAGSITSPKLSIAVLPFDNLSGDPDQDYFADAITEDLITDLSRIRDAFVIARRTSFTYKGNATDVKQVASELGVRYILEGSVQRLGDSIRINAQLIDGKTNGHIWSDRFDRDLTDAFSIQNEVTGQIAAALKAELREADRQRQGPPSSFEAWDYALRGNVLLFNPKGASDYLESKRLLDKAISLDPNIASARSGLAFVHFVASLVSIPDLSVPESKDLSLAAAQRAVSLDPKNAEGHWMVGVGYARNGQTDLAWASCESAMELNPNNDCAYVCADLTRMAMGQPKNALVHFQQSLRLNPRFRPFTKYGYMGIALVQAGEDSQAITMLSRAISGAPGNAMNHYVLASALAHIGRLDEAKAAIETAETHVNGRATTIATLRRSHSWLGPGFDRVLDGLRVAGLAES